MWVLFEWLSGSVVREFETSDDKIVLDVGGEDSAELSVPLASLPLSVRKNWRNTFTGIKRGVLYYENTASGAEVLYAGQITKASLDGEEIKISASSMLTYLTNYSYVPVGTTSITNAKATQKFSKVTAKSYITSLLAPVNDDAYAPNISIGSNPGPSRTLSTEIRLRDLSSVGELLLGQLEDPAGSEFRFMPSLNSGKTQVSWTIDFPSSGRLLRGTGETVGVNLSNPDVKLVSLSPSEDFSDFFNSLWHEIDVEEGVNIQRSDNIPSGFPRFNEYINFASALTAEERAEQVTARLEDASKGLQNWEVQIFNEQVNAQNEILLPGARYGVGYLGKQVSIQGGEEFDADSLNGTYRCLGVQFSSHDSIVTMQLADSREVYPRVPKRIIDRIGKDLTKTPAFKIPPSEKVGGGWEAPAPGDGGTPGTPGLPPGHFAPNEDWDWGSEVNPFPGMPQTTEPIYGFKAGEPTRSNPFIKGGNIPADNSAKQWIWTQGPKGNDIYATWWEGDDQPTSSIIHRGSVPPTTGSGSIRIDSLGLHVRMTKDADRNSIVPPGISDQYKIAISSGVLKGNTIEDFSRRILVDFNAERISNLMFSSGDWKRGEGIFGQKNYNLGVNIVISGVVAGEDRLYVYLDLEVGSHSGSGFNTNKEVLKRVLVLRKNGYKEFDDLVTISISRGFFQAGDLPLPSNVLTETALLVQPLVIQDKVLQPFTFRAVSNASEEEYKSYQMPYSSVSASGFFHEIDNVTLPFAKDSSGEEYRVRKSTLYSLAASKIFTAAKRGGKNCIFTRVGGITGKTSYAFIPLMNSRLGSLAGEWELLKDNVSRFLNMDPPSAGNTRYSTTSPIQSADAIHTIHGTPLLFWFAKSQDSGSSNSNTYSQNELAIYWAYLNRLHTSTGEEDVVTVETYGIPAAKVENNGEPGGPHPSGTSFRYTEDSLMPKISYFGKIIPKTERQIDSFWLTGGNINNVPFSWRDHPPSIFYWNNKLYILPNLKSIHNGTDGSGGLALPQMIAMDFFPEMEPGDYLNGNIPVNDTSPFDW